MEFVPLEEAANVAISGREILNERLLAQSLDEMLAMLPERYRLVLEHRFFLGLTFKQIGLILHISGTRASQLCQFALRKMRHPSTRYLLADCGIVAIEEKIRDDAKRVLDKLQEKAEAEKKRVRDLVERYSSRDVVEKLAPLFYPVDHPEFHTGIRAKPSEKPPFFVRLVNMGKGWELTLDRGIGVIKRELDPEMYDRWLNYLLAQNKQM